MRFCATRKRSSSKQRDFDSSLNVIAVLNVILTARVLQPRTLFLSAIDDWLYDPGRKLINTAMFVFILRDGIDQCKCLA